MLAQLVIPYVRDAPAGLIRGSQVQVLKGELIYLTFETYYKGNETQNKIKIITPAQQGLCGIVPKVGERWLIFAYEEEQGFHTELCTRTKNLNPKAWDYRKDEIDDDIKFLEAKLLANKEHFVAH